MKKVYAKPVVEVTNCEPRQILAASVSFQDGETNTMYSPELNALMLGWED